jgi:hypothetical protein
MAADRPDFTESSITVDAGAVQVEMSFIDDAKAGDDHTWTVASVNIKLGLLNDVDLQFVYNPYAQVNEGCTTTSGFGDDIQFRVKMNLWGTDLCEGVGLGLMFETDFVYDADDVNVFTGVTFQF